MFLPFSAILFRDGGVFTPPENKTCNGTKLGDDGCPWVSCGGFLMTRFQTHSCTTYRMGG
jgi:hypothetical protein